MRQDGLTPVLLALHAGNKNLVTVLIENGADINTPALDVRMPRLFSKIMPNLIF